MDKFTPDVCKSHSCRGDKDRICPSKLSKQELEDLYFALLESNVDLKRTVNCQKEKLKALSTKLLRISSAQKRHLCKTPSKCCVNAYSVIEQQKNIIEDMTQGSSKLVEKNRQLSMKLCTRKQFKRSSPIRAVSKNRSISAGAYSKKSQDRMESDTNITSTVVTDRSQKSFGEEENTVLENTTGNFESAEKNGKDRLKNEIVDLKQKIQDLQEELGVSRTEYAARLRLLEAETERVQAEARRRLQEHTQQRLQLATQLRCARSSTNSLTTELAIEKRKVNELHTQVRAASLAQEVVKMLEDHLMNLNKKSEIELSLIRKAQDWSPERTRLRSCCVQDNLKPVTDTEVTVEEMPILQQSNQDTKGLIEIIEQLMKTISVLQSELDALKISQSSDAAYPNQKLSKPQEIAGVATEQLSWNKRCIDADPCCLIDAGVDSARKAFVDAGVSPDSMIDADCESSPTKDFVHPKSHEKQLSSCQTDSWIELGNRSKEEPPSPKPLSSPFYKPCLSKQTVDNEQLLELTPIKDSNANTLVRTENVDPCQCSPAVNCDCGPEPRSQQPSIGTSTGSSMKSGERKSMDDSPSRRKLLQMSKHRSSTTEVVDICECPPLPDCECSPEPQTQQPSSCQTDSWIQLGDRMSKDDPQRQQLPQLSKQKQSFDWKQSIERAPIKNTITKSSVDDSENVDPCPCVPATDEPDPREHEQATTSTDKRILLKKQSNAANVVDACECPPLKDCGCSPAPSRQPSVSGDTSRGMSAKDKMSLDEWPCRQQSSLINNQSNAENFSGACECTPMADGKFPLEPFSKYSNSAKNSIMESPSRQKLTSNAENFIDACECAPTTDIEYSSDPHMVPVGNETSKIISKSESPNRRKTLKGSKKTRDAANFVDACECPPATSGEYLPEMCSPNCQSANRQLAAERKIQDDSCAPQKLSNKPICIRKHSFETKLNASTNHENESRILCACGGGSEKFKTVSLYKNKLKTCACKPINPKPKIRKMSQSFTCMVLETLTDTVPNKNSSSSVASNKTYTVKSENAETMSANNTDRDVASIPERSDKDAGCSSSADDRHKNDGSEYYSSTEPTSYSETADTSSKLFSDGEIPMCARKRNSGELRSARQDKDTALNGNCLNIGSGVDSTSFKVEEALRAISHELCKCRELLLTQKQPQIKEELPARVLDSQTDTALVLKKSVATPKIPETPEHLCSFTLHVGSIILSDEAMVWARARELFLQWRFYDQNYTITPMLGDRVMHFNFSTQYFISVNTVFLHYLSNAQMVLLVCEIGKQKTPFAHCAFPLRDVLANPNRRLNVSAPLLSGAPLPEPDHTGGELGVIDLWCLLHFDEHSGSIFDAALTQAVRQVSCTSTRREKSTTISLMEKISEECSLPLQDAGVNSEAVKIFDAERPASPNVADEMRELSQTRLENNFDMESMKSDMKKTRFNDQDVLDVTSLKYWSRAYSGTSSSFGTPFSQPGVSKIDTKKVTIYHPDYPKDRVLGSLDRGGGGGSSVDDVDCVDVTVLWLALNEECAVMSDAGVTQLYVSYTFLGRSGADLETPYSMPKPSHYAEKVHFNFSKRFYLESCERRVLAHMASCKASKLPLAPPKPPPPEDAIIFSVVSEPAEDPLGVDNCKEIGHAYLYLGDLLTYSSGDSYTEVVAVYPPDDHSIPEPAETIDSSADRDQERGGGAASGVLAVRVDGLTVVRNCAAHEG